MTSLSSYQFVGVHVGRAWQENPMPVVIAPMYILSYLVGLMRSLRR